MSTCSLVPSQFSNFEVATLAEYQMAAAALAALKRRLEVLDAGVDRWGEVVANVGAAVWYPDECDRCVDEERDARPTRTPFGVDAIDGGVVAHYLCPADGHRWARTWPVPVRTPSERVTSPR